MTTYDNILSFIDIRLVKENQAFFIYLNTKLEPKNQSCINNRENNFTTLMPWHCSLLRRVHLGASQAFLRDQTWWGNRPKLSLDKGFFSAFFYTPAIVRTIQLAEKMWEGSIYRRGGSGLGSFIRWKRGLIPLGSCTFVGNKKPKGGLRRYSIEQTMMTVLTKFLGMEILFLYKIISKNSLVQGLH